MVRMVLSRALVGVGVGALVALGGVGARGVALTASTPPYGACELTGSASFTPGLTGTPKAEAYSFKGALSNCHGSNSKITRGTVYATGSGSLACAGGTGHGNATVTWNTGQKTYVKFSTTSAAAATAINGSVTSGLYKGDSAAGSVVFQTTTPQACASSGGLKTLTFTGGITVG